MTPSPLFAAFALGLLPLAEAQDKPTPAQRFAELQANLVKETTQQLRSDNLATVAWGAHAAARFRLSAAIPDLRSKLADIAKGKGADRSYVALALLDALIQTTARVPGDEVKPFVTGTTMESALALLLLHGKEHNKDLALFLAAYCEIRGGNQTWLVCGNLLADALAPDFALELLREPMPLSITVWDPGHPAEDLSAMGHSSGCVRLKPPDGYPPTILYGLSSDRSRRFASEWLVSAERDFDSDAFRTARTRWMKQMLGTTAAAVPFDLAPLASIAWSNLDQLLAVEREHRRNATAMHRALTAACVKAKLITADAAATLEPTIETYWNDFRTDQSVALPKGK